LFHVGFDFILLAIIAKTIVHGYRSTAIRAREGLVLLLDERIHAKIAHNFQVFYRTNAIIAAIPVIKILQFITRKTRILETVLDFFPDPCTAILLDEGTILIAHATPRAKGYPRLLGHTLRISQVGCAHATINATWCDQSSTFQFHNQNEVTLVNQQFDIDSYDDEKKISFMCSKQVRKSTLGSKK